MLANTMSLLRVGMNSMRSGPRVVMPSCTMRISTVPISAPTMEPSPPTIIMAMNQIELKSVNWSTETKRIW